MNLRGINITQDMTEWADKMNDILMKGNFNSTRQHISYLALIIAISKGYAPNKEYKKQPLFKIKGKPAALYSISASEIYTIMQAKFPDIADKDMADAISSLTDQGLVFIRDKLAGDETIINFARLLDNEETYAQD